MTWNWVSESNKAAERESTGSGNGTRVVQCSRNAHDRNVLVRQAQLDHRRCHSQKGRQASLEGSFRWMRMLDARSEEQRGAPFRNGCGGKRGRSASPSTHVTHGCTEGRRNGRSMPSRTRGRDSAAPSRTCGRDTPFPFPTLPRIFLYPQSTTEAAGLQRQWPRRGREICRSGKSSVSIVDISRTLSRR